MRIVGGEFRGRPLLPPTDRDIRPTADRVREALFNVLMHAEFAPDFDGLTVLDVCCGTGALGLEALSRGAHRALLLDHDQAALAIARQNVASLGVADRCQIIRGDATKPGAAPAAAGLVLIDPPYGAGITERALPALAAAGWLTDSALAIVEDDVPPSAISGFERIDQRSWGRATIGFWRRVAG